MIEWIVVLHVLAGAAWFGGQVYVEGLMAAAARTKESSTILTITGNIVKTSVRVFSGAAVLLLITGVWIVLDESTPFEFEDLFVSIGFLIVLIGLGITLFYFRPKGAALDSAIAEQGVASTAALATAKQVSMVSHIMTLLVTIALIVMVLKTGL
ncbi:MAG: DUF2269 family protein [Actinomycetota bacterium]